MKKILLLSALLSTFALGLSHISNSDVIEYSSETPTMLKANEEESDVYLLYFKSPTNWGTPNVWAWEDGPGTNPFPELGWPGRAMIEDENNDGWYYIYLPSYIDKVIFNATDTEGNAVQTDGDGVDPENKFTISPQNQWIDGIHEETKTNEDGTKSTIYMPNTPSYTQLTEGELPIYEEEAVIYARVPNDWNKAVATFTDSENEGDTYTKELTYNSTEKWYIDRVPAKYDKVTLNDGETENLKESTEVDVTGGTPYYIQVTDEVNAEGKYNATVVYEKPVDESEVFAVHAKVPENWTKVGLWAFKYDGGVTAIPGTWPGVEMTLDSDGEWYTYEGVSNIADRVVINQFVFEGGLQTVDIKIESKECWVVLTELNDKGQYEADVYYEEPTIEEPTDPTDPSDPTDPTDPTTPTEPTDEGGLTGGQIAGIVIGVIALVAIIGAIVIVLVKKNKKSKNS